MASVQRPHLASRPPFAAFAPELMRLAQGHVSQGQRLFPVHHDHEADHLRRAVKKAEGVGRIVYGRDARRHAPSAAIRLG